MRFVRGGWVLPVVGPPIRDGWVLIDRCRILAVGGPSDQVPLARPATPDLHDPATVSLSESAIVPGLVNAHTHLELSCMRDRLKPAESMPGWAAGLISLRQTIAGSSREAITDAICEARAAGTALIGETTNTLAAYDPLADSEFAAAIFLELLGFRGEDADRLMGEAQAKLDRLTPSAGLRISIVPHAPYSVSPALFRAIAAAGTQPISVHLGESAEEIRFLADGTGAWRRLLEQLGVWDPCWDPPRCRPVEYLDRLGLLNHRLLAVHAVQLTDAELERLARASATVVTCPRSNRWTAAGTPPIDRFYQSGVRVAIGTDSLASVDDLSIFAELAEVRRLAPSVPATRILRSATIDGADALGFGSELGTIEPGKRAELIAVRVPADVKDVEEYLVSGVEPERIRWLER